MAKHDPSIPINRATYVRIFLSSIAQLNADARKVCRPVKLPLYWEVVVGSFGEFELSVGDVLHVQVIRNIVGDGVATAKIQPEAGLRV
jgi:hypothetical protein